MGEPVNDESENAFQPRPILRHMSGAKWPTSCDACASVPVSRRADELRVEVERLYGHVIPVQLVEGVSSRRLRTLRHLLLLNTKHHAFGASRLSA